MSAAFTDGKEDNAMAFIHYQGSVDGKGFQLLSAYTDPAYANRGAEEELIHEALRVYFMRSPFGPNREITGDIILRRTDRSAIAYVKKQGSFVADTVRGGFPGGGDLVVLRKRSSTPPDSSSESPDN